jgi:hypothetical protein
VSEVEVRKSLSPLLNRDYQGGKSKERITLDMSLQDVMHAMSGGNPGALIACMELMKQGPSVDPNALFGGLAQLMALDSLGIWESRIYMLWNDVCHRDTGATIAVLRAYQLGQLAGVTKQALNHAIEHRGQGLDISAIVAAVKERLPSFNPSAGKSETEE